MCRRKRFDGPAGSTRDHSRVVDEGAIDIVQVQRYMYIVFEEERVGSKAQGRVRE